MTNPAASALRQRWPLAALAAFLLAEIALRAFGYHGPEPEAPTFQYDPARDPILRAGDGLHVDSVRELWMPAPGATLPWQPGERVNAAGYRGAPLETVKTPGRLRIALLGDGNTFGEGVAWPESYGAQLALRLAEAATPAEVLDAGVIGFSAEQCFQRYLELVRPSQPDLALLAVTGVEEARPSEFVTDHTRIEQSLGRSRGWSFVPSEPLDVRTLAWLQEQVPGFQPVQVDAKFLDDFLERRRMRLAEDVAQNGHPDWPGTRRVPLPDFEQCLRRFVRRARADRTEPYLVCVPRPPELDAAQPVLAWYDDALRCVALDEHTGLVDGGAFFVDVIKAGVDPSRLFVGEKLSVLGHALFAEELARWIVADHRY